MDPEVGEDGGLEPEALDVLDVGLVLEPEDLLRVLRGSPRRAGSARARSSRSRRRPALEQPDAVLLARACTRAAGRGAGRATRRHGDRPRGRPPGTRSCGSRTNASSSVASHCAGARRRRRRPRPCTATSSAGRRGRRRSARCSSRCGRRGSADRRAVSRILGCPVGRRVVPDHDLARRGRRPEEHVLDALCAANAHDCASGRRRRCRRQALGVAIRFESYKSRPSGSDGRRVRMARRRP